MTLRYSHLSRNTCTGRGKWGDFETKGRRNVRMERYEKNIVRSHMYSMRAHCLSNTARLRASGEGAKRS